METERVVSREKELTVGGELKGRMECDGQQVFDWRMEDDKLKVRARQSVDLK